MSSRYSCVSSILDELELGNVGFVEGGKQENAELVKSVKFSELGQPRSKGL